MADCTEGTINNGYDYRELVWKPATGCDSCGTETRPGICDRTYTLGEKCNLFDYTADARAVAQDELVRKYVGGKWIICGSIPQPPDDSTITLTRDAAACGITLWDADPPAFSMYDIYKNCGKFCKAFVYPYLKISSLPGSSLSTTPEEFINEWQAIVRETPYWTSAMSTTAETIPAAASASPVVGVTYGTSKTCKTYYAVHANRTVTYSVNGATAVNLAIGAALAADVPRWIKVIGNNLVVGFATGHYYTTLTDGVPGATWTRVAYAAAITNNSRSYVDSSGRVWETTGIAGVAGLVSSTALAAQQITMPIANTMLDVTGCGNKVIYGGTVMTILATSNGGSSFSQIPFTLPVGAAAIGAANITAIESIDANTLVIGTSTGRVFATCNASAAVPTWIEAALPTDASSAAQVNDLAWFSRDIGYVARGNMLYRTIGGFRSDNLPAYMNFGSSDILSYAPGTVTAINSIDLPSVGSEFNIANSLLAAATAGAGGAVVNGSISGGIALS